jgi:hypothetical protein
MERRHNAAGRGPAGSMHRAVLAAQPGRCGDVHRPQGSTAPIRGLNTNTPRPARTRRTRPARSRPSLLVIKSAPEGRAGRRLGKRALGHAPLSTFLSLRLSGRSAPIDSTVPPNPQPQADRTRPTPFRRRCLRPGRTVAAQQDVARKRVIGWSSMPFGAMPVWPCMKSKNPTPSMVAVPSSVSKVSGGGPQIRSNDLRAARIFRRATLEARAMQSADGISTIIVRGRLVNEEITRCTSPSSSARTPMS